LGARGGEAGGRPPQSSGFRDNRPAEPAAQSQSSGDFADDDIPF